MTSTLIETNDLSTRRPEMDDEQSSYGGGADSNLEVLGISRMMYSRLIGALFLAAFVLYGVGNGLVTSVAAAPDLLSNISAYRATLLVGAFLMLMNSPAVVGIGVLLFPILANQGSRTAVAYLAPRIAEGILLAIGVLSLLMVVPLAERVSGTADANATWASSLVALAFQSNTMTYQIGEMSLGIGSIFMCLLLFRTALVPRPLAVSGVIGYAIFLAGAVAEILQVHVGLILSIPGGLFELAFACWLLVKGFQPVAHGRHAGPVRIV